MNTPPKPTRFNTAQARKWARKEAALGTTRTLLLEACTEIEVLRTLIGRHLSAYAPEDEMSESDAELEAILP